MRRFAAAAPPQAAHPHRRASRPAAPWNQPSRRPSRRARRRPAAASARRGRPAPRPRPPAAPGSTQTSTVGPAPGERRPEVGRPRDALAHGAQQRHQRRPVGLVQAVVERLGDQVGVARARAPRPAARPAPPCAPRRACGTCAGSAARARRRLERRRSAITATKPTGGGSKPIARGPPPALSRPASAPPLQRRGHVVGMALELGRQRAAGRARRALRPRGAGGQRRPRSWRRSIPARARTARVFSMWTSSPTGSPPAAANARRNRLSGAARALAGALALDA